MLPEPSIPPLKYRLWPVLGFLGGGLLGLVDALFFSGMDTYARLFGQEVNLAVTVGFSLNLALCGYALGRLAVARSRARTDHRTIAEQHDALLRSHEALVQHEKLAALGRLVASIAHELRNPLGVIRSASGILIERGSGDAQLQRAAELVTEEVDHMNATITALLAFARPADLKLEEVAVERVIERARHLTEARSADPTIEITRRLPQHLPAVLGDFNLLAQVVAGLVDNAAEALAAGGGGHIELRAGRTNGSLRIEVADDGPGIPGDQADRVFEPFYTTKPSGTGLGLALAHRIADAHHGRLEVVPAAGVGPGQRGACLRLSLPLSQGESPHPSAGRPRPLSQGERGAR